MSNNNTDILHRGLVHRSTLTASCNVYEYSVFNNTDGVCVFLPMAAAHQSRYFGLTLPLTFLDRIKIMFGFKLSIDVVLCGTDNAVSVHMHKLT